MKVFRGIAELQRQVGSHLGWSPWHSVDQTQIDSFAEATGDHQWIHVDSARAANGPFGCTIAHGYLTLSLTSLLVSQIYRVDGMHMSVNYGTNKVRFPSPLPVDSRIRAGAELLGLEPHSAGYHVVTGVTVEREGGRKPVCVAQRVALLVEEAPSMS